MNRYKMDKKEDTITCTICKTKSNLKKNNYGVSEEGLIQRFKKLHDKCVPKND